MRNTDIELLRMLAERLERLSADSLWARRASGLRGNIIKVLEDLNAGQEIGYERLSALIQNAFEILQRAAQEIPDIDEIMNQTMRNKRGSYK
jgi:hypothetical protein